MNYIDVFIKSLEFYGGSKEFDDYRYVGGANEHHAKYFLNLKCHLPHLNYCNIYEAEILRKNKKVFFLQPRLSETKKKDEHNCLCGHDITYLMYIQHKKGGDILVVGNCCIQKFLPKDEEKKRKTQRLCICCDKFHGGVKYFECDECKNYINKIKKKFSKCLTKIKNMEKDKYTNRMYQLKCMLFGKNGIGYVGSWFIYIGKYKGKEVKYYDLVKEETNYCKFLVNNVSLNEKVKEYLIVMIELIEVEKKLKQIESEK